MIVHRIVTRLRRWLLAGLLLWLPLGVTILTFRFLLNLMDRMLFLLPPAYRPEQWLGFRVPGLGLILTILLLLVTGILAANLIGRRLVSLYEAFLARIPFVRSVYGAVKSFSEVVLSGSSTSFKKVVLIEYPRMGMYSVAFQTSEDAEEIQARTGSTVVTVFLPTTPNPTSGYMLFVQRSEVTVLDMSVEEALKLVVSLGVVVPKWHPVHPERAADAARLEHGSTS